MEIRARKDPALVYANVGVHGGVEITLAMDPDGGDGAAIHFGQVGPDLVLDIADVGSLDRLAVVAAEGARRLRERIGRSERAAVAAAEVDHLVGARVAG
ncbi:MAG: hypothetical protein GEV28_03350 [Actinophytocola sp.]|uniref:hypothetical protein n=1 Tax=Actinophytocola sp. TaxID=1872138 RepID=UPI00132899CD|nr:hypothetical protein [Actinophytocola sp.]MPZ79470.1 hypothetical protein [Actinophytocola sp.]